MICCAIRNLTGRKKFVFQGVKKKKNS